MSNPYDFTTEIPEFLQVEKIIIFNPNPYPLQATSNGHILGGGESAIVVRHDSVVQKALNARLVSEIEQQPEVKTRKKRS